MSGRGAPERGTKLQMHFTHAPVGQTSPSCQIIVPKQLVSRFVVIFIATLSACPTMAWNSCALNANSPTAVRSTPSPKYTDM
jgi:hypothetical protein